MKNKVLVMVLAMVLVFSCTAAAFADSGDVGVMPLDTNSVYFVINRTSGTTADATVDVTFTRIADEYSVVVYLQNLRKMCYIYPQYQMNFAKLLHKSKQIFQHYLNCLVHYLEQTLMLTLHIRIFLCI